MLAVIFEVFPTTEGMTEYLEIAAELRGFLENRGGFISTLPDRKRPTHRDS